MKSKFLIYFFICIFSLSHTFAQTICNSPNAGVDLSQKEVDKVSVLKNENTDLSDIYSSLSNSTSSISIYPLLEKLTKTEKDPAKLEDAIKKYIPNLTEIDEMEAIHEQLAYLLLLRGKLDDAQKAFYDTARYCRDKKKAEFLLVSARLSIELGMYDECVRIVSEIPGSLIDHEVKNNADIVRALALHGEGKNTEAISYLSETQDNPRWLFSRFVIYRESGHNEKALQTLSLLANNYKGSPEYYSAMFIAGEKIEARLELFPSPQYLLAIAEDAVNPLEKNDEPCRIESAKKDYIQAGSFRLKENAECLFENLASKGFCPEIYENKIGGKPLYIVNVLTNKDSQSVQKLLARLQESGFDGFIVSK
jgi:tetratricopeptide (TPR) repeat protein